MAKINVGPTEGFILECAITVAAVIFTIICVQEGIEVLPVCVGAWFMAIVNFPQVIRFFTDKPARKYYTKFNRAIEILRNPQAKEEEKKKAFDDIVEAARGNYRPAVIFLSKINKR